MPWNSDASIRTGASWRPDTKEPTVTLAPPRPDGVIVCLDPKLTTSGSTAEGTPR